MKLDQGVALQPVQESWIPNQPQGDSGRSNLPTALALLHDATPSYDVLPVASPSDPPPAFKRPRTWDEALQQGSGENDCLRYSLATNTRLRLECSLGPLSRALPALASRETRTATRPSSFQGRLSAIQSNFNISYIIWRQAHEGLGARPRG